MNARNFVILDPVPVAAKDPISASSSAYRDKLAQVIFPDETIFECHIARADGNEIKIATQRRDTITPLISACVDHMSTFDDVRDQIELTEDLVGSRHGRSEFHDKIRLGKYS